MTTIVCQNVPRGRWLAVALAAACWHTTSLAHACLWPIDPAPKFTGIPTDGEKDVPTNVVPLFFFVPWYETDANGVPGTFVIETLTGELVPNMPRLVSTQYFQLEPLLPLQPNTGYRIRGTWKRMQETYETQVEFTTGAGPRTGPVKAPVARLVNLDWHPTDWSTCDPPTQSTCVALQENPTGDARVEIALIGPSGSPSADSRDYTPASTFTSGLSPTFSSNTSHIDCVSLRTRAIDGTFSEPIRLCGADAPVVQVASDGPVNCTNDGLSWPGSPENTEMISGAQPVGSSAPIAGHAAATRSTLEAAGAQPETTPAAGHVQSCSVTLGRTRSPLRLLVALGSVLLAWGLRRQTLGKQKTTRLGCAPTGHGDTGDHQRRRMVTPMWSKC